MTAVTRTRVGYLQLLRGNGAFRRLWIGAVSSYLGDWLNTIAIYTLVQRLTGSPLALGLVFITKMLPFALASPLAGLLSDRFNRRRLMIASDLARAVIVLGFLLIEDAGDLYLLYTLTALQICLGAVFIPARSASIPNITSDAELLTANALSAATWSVLLAVGAALGGLVTEWLGVRAVFLLDSASYCVSALFILRTVIPQKTEPTEGASASAATVLRDIVDGWRHLQRFPRVGRIALAKSSWAIGGGALVYMLALLGQELVPGAPALGIGLLYAARGLGTGIGPIAARAWLPDERRWPTLLGLCVAASGLLYLGVGLFAWSGWLILLIVAAHACSGANWVMSTVLLQKRTVDRYRGRVFSTEWLLLTLVDAVAILIASLVLETELFDLRRGFVLFAAVQFACGIGWLTAIAPRERAGERPPQPTARSGSEP